MDKSDPIFLFAFGLSTNCVFWRKHVFFAYSPAVTYSNGGIFIVRKKVVGQFLEMIFSRIFCKNIK